MRKLKHVIFFFSIISAILLMNCSSEEEECPDEAIPYLNMSIKRASGLKVDTILIYNDKLAEYLYKGTQPADCIMVPLELNADSTLISVKFTLIADSTRRVKDSLLDPYLSYFNDSVAEITDAVMFLHNKEVRLNELECGFINVFYLKNVFYNNQVIDSVYVYDTVINTSQKNHVTLFY